MLERPGDLIPVVPGATAIPWTRRRDQIFNFVQRGPVTFSTMVFDTNVGDISPLATYFNPDRISERELNTRFGHDPTTSEKHASPHTCGDDGEPLLPRILIYPIHDTRENTGPAKVKDRRTLDWVLSQEHKRSTSLSSGTSGRSSPDLAMMRQARRVSRQDTSMPPPASTRPLNMTMPAINSALESLWKDQGDTGTSDPWPPRSGDFDLGLGQLATRLNKSMALEVSSLMDPMWEDQAKNRQEAGAKSFHMGGC